MGLAQLDIVFDLVFYTIIKDGVDKEWGAEDVFICAKMSTLVVMFFTVIPSPVWNVSRGLHIQELSFFLLFLCLFNDNKWVTAKTITALILKTHSRHSPKHAFLYSDNAAGLIPLPPHHPLLASTVTWQRNKAWCTVLPLKAGALPDTTDKHTTMKQAVRGWYVWLAWGEMVWWYEVTRIYRQSLQLCVKRFYSLFLQLFFEKLKMFYRLNYRSKILRYFFVN